jgi:uncharacterized metal-binding protein YceD (DUF177 family)
MAADRIEPDVGKAWPQLLGLSEVGKDAVRRRLVADADARARIAKVLRLASLTSLVADLKVSSWLDGVQIGGTWRATVGQICGVTLDPFESELDGELQIRAVPMGSQALQTDEDHELELDPDADDPPDVLAGDQLDLGAYVVEDLSLAIDPFPRKPGAAFEPPETSAEISPFAVLAKLKGGLPDS